MSELKYLSQVMCGECGHSQSVHNAGCLIAGCECKRGNAEIIEAELERLETALQDARYVIEEFDTDSPIGVGPQWKQAFINARNWMRDNK